MSPLSSDFSYPDPAASTPAAFRSKGARRVAERAPERSAPRASSPKNVLEMEERIEVSDTGASPYESIAILHAFNGRDARARAAGTAFRVGPSSWVTAGHVVCHRGRFARGGRAERVLLWPGFSRRRTLNPAYESEVVEPHPQFAEAVDGRFNLAVIVLPDSVPGRPLRFGELDYSRLLHAELGLAGFPAARGGDRMLEGRGGVTRLEALRFYHDVETWDGQGGAPLWVEGIESPLVIGMNLSGAEHGGRANAESNRALRFTAQVLAWIEQQAARGGR